jgi:hypothetical protein
MVDRMSGAERLAAATTVFGLLHHADHVFRYDHSGWPFRAEVTPFTFSLLVYVVIVLLFALRGFRGTRVLLAGMLFLFPTLAHIYLETPMDQYRTWAHRSDVNLLHVSAPLMGAAAVIVTVLLSACALATLVRFWREARRRV